MIPEGDSELPDEGLPDEMDEDDCAKPMDIFRARTESIPEND